ncbi:alpha/beta hydrolase family protein [Sphingobium sp. SCG-1]|uniref:alpha/beta hydrolase family protein n=1 Tax=Sphingobium sp. SCG-1 TaxID=2072936 RepID=UPI001CB969D7|nr:S9 family peptidase [Sphingobium sp. SCG-1]
MSFWRLAVAMLAAIHGFAPAWADQGSNVDAPAQAAAPPPKPAPSLGKLPVAAFAKLPFLEMPVLSPNGQMIAGLFGARESQVIGLMNLFAKGGPMTIGIPEGTQVQWIRWVNDDRIIIGLTALIPMNADRWYVSRLISMDVKTGKPTRLLWDLKGQNASDVLWVASDGSPDILVAAQNSIYFGPDFWPSVYRVDTATGRKSRVVLGREGVHDWSADITGRIRSGLAYNDRNRTFKLLYRDAAGDAFQIIDSADSRKRETLQWPFLFLPGGSHALVMHDDDRGRSGIYETDLLTQKDVRTVFTMPDDSSMEVASPLLSDDGATLLGVATTDLNNSVHWIDPALAELQALFDKSVPGKRARIVSFSKDRSMMLVQVGGPDMPGSLYYFSMNVGVLNKIADVNQDVRSRRLAPVKAIRYKARDGLEIEGILTLPTGLDPRALPFIVMPHGGPWARDALNYDYIAQFLANRGYAVLQPNFRGSTGYGTEFLRKGEGEMGLAMQDDVTDAVQWAVKEGIADPRRTCIVGASYGGYAAMWGIAKEPERYRCAISIAGVASLRREVNDFGNNLMGGKFKDDWGRMTPNFEAVSPINAVDRIKTPLLLIHGKRDVTVDVSQSSRMFARMQGAGKQVEYVPVPLADHYFTRQPDRITLLTALETFLAKHNPSGDAAAGEVAAAQ